MAALRVLLFLLIGVMDCQPGLADPFVAFSNIPPPGNYKQGGTYVTGGAWKALLFTTPVSSQTEIVSIRVGLTDCQVPCGHPNPETYPVLVDFQLSLYSVSNQGGVPTPDAMLYSMPMQYGLILTQRGTEFTFGIPNWSLAANTTYALVAKSTDSRPLKWSNIELASNDYSAQAQNGFAFTTNPGFLTDPAHPDPLWISSGAATNNAVEMKVHFVPPPPIYPPGPSPDAPLLPPSGAETTTGSPVTGTLVSSGGPGAVYYLVTQPTHGNATIQTDGTYFYSPNPGYQGLDSLGYIACSGGPCNMTTSATCTGSLCSPGTLNIGVAQANTTAQSDTAGTGVQQNITNVTDNVSWNGQPANSPLYQQQIFVLSNAAAVIPTAAARSANGATLTATTSPVSVNTLTGEITLEPRATPGTYTVKTLLCLTLKSQSSLEKLWELLAIKSAFADASTAVTLHGAAPCVNQTTNVLVESTIIAQDYTFNTWINMTLTGSVATNDTYPVGAIFGVLTDVSQGKLAFFNDGGFAYRPKHNFKGVDGFTYSLCEPAPKSSICTSAAVKVNVGNVKIPQKTLNLNASSTTTTVNVPVRLVARGGSVKAIPIFTAVANSGADCKIKGTGSTRSLHITGASGASCSVTAAKRGNKEYEPLTSNSVTVTLQ